MPLRLLVALALATSTACATGAQHAAAASTASTASAKLDPAWAPLAFLVGDWQSVGAGASGGFTLLPELDGKVLVRRNVAVLPQGRHEDLMVVYREGEALRALYVDNEGHAIHYAVETGERTATFTSDEAPGRPRFRLDYALGDDGKLGVTFALQPPGAPDFKTYLQGTAIRR